MPSGDVEKFYKTASVFAVGGLFLTPLAHRFGVSATFALQCAGLFGLHEFGRHQPGRVSTNIHSLFGPKACVAVENVIKGGAALVDCVIPPSKGGSMW
jgi:hypothetical protein